MESESFDKIAHSFSSNLGALRIFNEQIGPLADEHDRNQIRNLAKLLRESAQYAGGNQLSPLPPERTTAKEARTKVEKKAEEFLHDFFEAFSLDTEKQGKFMDRLTTLIAKTPPPVQGGLLRRGALTILVSYFEALLADIIKEFYKRYPSALPEEVQAPKLSEIRRLKSLEEVEDYVIAKEVDSVLRKSLVDQLDYLAKRPGVNLKPLEQYKERLIEIDQRRNLLVHNGGKVNRIYLERTPDNLVQEYKLKEGDTLAIRKEYLSGAIDCVYLAGTIIIQQSYRKWEKEKLEWADSQLLSHLYASLQEKKYEITIKLSDFAKHIKCDSEDVKRHIVINHAIGLRELDRVEEVQHVIGALDWSACSMKLKIAFHVLKDDIDLVFELLPRAIASGEIKVDNLQEWPLFDRLRTLERFQEILEKNSSQQGNTLIDVHPVSKNVDQ